MKKKTRDSGIELLRIITMLMVILIHGFLYGSFHSEAIAVGGVMAEVSTIVKISLRPAVDIFIMISGFFMVRSSFNLEKTFKRAGDTYSRLWFYSIALTAIFLALGPQYCVPVQSVTPVSVQKIILNGLFPVTSQTWYYLTNYLIICLLSPFINIVLQALTKKQYRTLLIILTCLMCFWMTAMTIYPFRLWCNDYSYESVFEGKGVFSFIYMYIVGGYFGLHSESKKKPQPRYAFLAITCVLVNYLLFTYLDKDIGYCAVAMNYSNPFVILQGISMLLFFKDLHFKNRLINLFGSTTMGVYAIHEFGFVRSFLWEKLFNFKNYDYPSVVKSFFTIFIISVGVFLVLGIIDLLVQKLFKLKDKAISAVKEKNKA